MTRWIVREGDAAEILPRMPSGMFGSLVTDPPAGIGFMGKEWDRDHGGRAAWIDVHRPIFAECLRLVRPGGLGIVWALPRTSHWTATALEDAGWEIRDVAVHLQAQGMPKSKALLKPAAEHWILARAPGPVLPIPGAEACRVASEGGGRARDGEASRDRVYSGGVSGFHCKPGVRGGHAAGRWPANVTLEHAEACGDDCADECPVAALDAQSGSRKSGSRKSGSRKGMGYAGATGDGGPAIVGSEGGASRFFYRAKLKGKERAATGHPTAKPTELMRWLVRLVTPPGGLVLDPFAGSGSTGLAAVAEGFPVVMVERDAGYVATIRRRMEGL